MNHKINAFLDRRILKADSTGCGEQMSVSPDGQIGICQNIDLANELLPSSQLSLFLLPGAEFY